MGSDQTLGASCFKTYGNVIDSRGSARAYKYSQEKQKGGYPALER